MVTSATFKLEGVRRVRVTALLAIIEASALVAKVRFLTGSYQT